MTRKFPLIFGFACSGVSLYDCVLGSLLCICPYLFVRMCCLWMCAIKPVCRIIGDRFYLHRYEGQWRKSNREGHGTYVWNTGDRYEGDWREGRKEGSGVFHFAKSGNRYEGRYDNDARNGFGTFYWANVCPPSLPCCSLVFFIRFSFSSTSYSPPFRFFICHFSALPLCCISFSMCSDNFAPG